MILALSLRNDEKEDTKATKNLSTTLAWEVDFLS